MKEATKTICFVVAAAAMMIAAIATNIANQPRPVADFETIGQAFYSDFTDTKLAKSLVVNGYDPVTVKPQTFEIKQEDGLWQIPSHDGYPAEAAERLGKTSASLMGLTRDSLVGRRVSDHTKFGVIDPRGDDILDMDAIGQSVTLKDANDDVLVDLIIGKQATDEDQRTTPGQAMAASDETHYYVRRADESNVYRIPLNIDLSTEFADWIEPDLLQLQASDVVSMKLNNYEIEARSSGLFGQTKTLVKKPGDQLTLTRPSSTEQWALEGLDVKSETLKAAEVASIVAVLDDMAIVDVKQKPTLDGKMLLDADLNYSVTPEQAKLMSVRTQAELDGLSPAEQAEFQRLQVAVAELQQDLQGRGFNFGSTGKALELVSAGGEVKAGTTDGLLYTLHVGKAKSGGESAIKLSGAKAGEPSDEEDAADNDTDDAKEDEADDKAGMADKEPNSEEETEADSDAVADAADSNRYVLIRVGFDESLLGEALKTPTEPVAPVKPEGYVSKEDEMKATGGKEQEDGGEAEAESDDAPMPKILERDPKFVAYDEALASYAEAKIDFEVATSDFKRQQEERASRIKEGKRKAEVLNQRFEKWYYVVAGDNLTTLQAARETLVNKKETPEAAADVGAMPGTEGLGKIPDTSFPEIDLPEAKPPADVPAKESEMPPVEKPSVQPPVEPSAPEEAAPESPATEQPAPAETSEMPAVEKPPVKPSAPEEAAPTAPESPAAEQLAPAESSEVKSAVDEPVVEKPAVEKPVVDEPAVEKPAVAEPSVEVPVAEKPKAADAPK